MDPKCFMPQIQKLYGTLTAAEKRIADYVLQYPSQTLSLSASALALQADTAASAVVITSPAPKTSGWSSPAVRPLRTAAAR